MNGRLEVFCPQSRKRIVAAMLMLGLATAGCQQQSSLPDPTATFQEIVQAARDGNGGVFYDMLDSARRAQVDTVIGMQLANTERLPPVEKKQWDSLKGLSKRDIYARMLSNDPALRRLFGSDARVVGTHVVLTVEYGAAQRDLLYLRWDGERYRIALPPDQRE